MGREACAAYQAVRELLAAKFPKLSGHVTRNVGHAMGLQFKEGGVSLNSKCR